MLLKVNRRLIECVSNSKKQAFFGMSYNVNVERNHMFEVLQL